MSINNESDKDNSIKAMNIEMNDKNENSEQTKILNDCYYELSSMKNELKAKELNMDINFENDIQKQANKENIIIPEMTTKKELKGWYLVDIANSPMWNVVVGFLWPLLVTNAGTEYACKKHTQYGCDWNWDPISPTNELKLMNGTFTPVSFTFGVQSISGALQAVAYVMFGMEIY